ncbi:MAG: hypothetical protein COA52_16110 [Hyphomicrobiales bacterium]|nr:MAG: hypothetical protein COA52_16110 [Hyphomicrobiales bacterium]
MLVRGDDSLEKVLVDGRQSDTALMIQRGVGRMLHNRKFAVLPELTLASGRRADLMALSSKGELWIIEIKSSVADFKADHKWPDYRDYCDRLFFASHAEVPEDLFPQEQGLMMADPYGAEILRDAPEHKLSAARRKAVTLRFAAAGATRLLKLSDPGLRGL